MESVKSFIGVVFLAVFGITIILNVLYVVIGLFYGLLRFCAKAIRKKAIRCPSCGSSLKEEQPQNEPESMNAELYARVKTLVAEQTGVSAEKLNPNTQLSNNLGIDGDDGVELLEAFCKEFEIQNTSEIDLRKHFAPEGCNAFGIYAEFYYLVFDREKLREEPAGDIPITLRDLVKSAEAKRWIPSEA